LHNRAERRSFSRDESWPLGNFILTQSFYGPIAEIYLKKNQEEDNYMERITLQMATAALGLDNVFALLRDSFFTPRSAHLRHLLIVNDGQMNVEESTPKQWHLFDEDQGRQSEVKDPENQITKEEPEIKRQVGISSHLLFDFFTMYHEILYSDMNYLNCLGVFLNSIRSTSKEDKISLDDWVTAKKTIDNYLWNIYIGLCPTDNQTLLRAVTMNSQLEVVGGEDFFGKDLVVNQHSGVFTMKKSVSDVLATRKIMLNFDEFWRTPTIQSELVDGWVKRLPKEMAEDVLQVVSCHGALPATIQQGIVNSGILNRLEDLCERLATVPKSDLWMPAFLRCLIRHLTNLDSKVDPNSRHAACQGRC
jgi:hypothetical protein